MQFTGKIEKQGNKYWLMVSEITAIGMGSSIEKAFKELQKSFYVICEDDNKEFAHIECKQESNKTFTVTVENSQEMFTWLLGRLRGNAGMTFSDIVAGLGQKSVGSIQSYFKDKQPSFLKACNMLNVMGYDVEIKKK